MARRSIFHNSVLAAFFYVGTLALLWVTGSLTASSVAISFVAAIAVRNGHRYYMIYEHGLTDWLHKPFRGNPAELP